MTHKQAIMWGLIGGAVVGYFMAGKLAAHSPWSNVAALV